MRGTPGRWVSPERTVNEVSSCAHPVQRGNNYRSRNRQPSLARVPLHFYQPHHSQKHSLRTGDAHFAPFSRWLTVLVQQRRFRAVRVCVPLLIEEARRSMKQAVFSFLFSDLRWWKRSRWNRDTLKSIEMDRLNRLRAFVLSSFIYFALPSFRFSWEKASFRERSVVQLGTEEAS